MSEKITILVEGGKASGGPPVGSTLGPMGINVSEVVNDINQKTSSFKGMKVPVDIIIEKDKSYKIEVGTPPVSQLIKKELNLDKGSGTPNIDKKANMGIEQAIKVAKMKQDSMFTRNLKSAVKSVVGSANAAGILVEGLKAVEVNPLIDEGKFDNEINNETTEVPQEKKAILKSQLEAVQESMQKELEKKKLAEEAEKAKEAKVAAAAAEGEEAKEGEEKKEGEAEEKKEGAAEEKKEEPKQEAKK
jgi:large subunit ribosomal protein L11